MYVFVVEVVGTNTNDLLINNFLPELLGSHSRFLQEPMLDHNTSSPVEYPSITKQSLTDITLVF